MYFESDTERRPLRLIRSAAAPGKPAVPVATRRAYDDPGVARVYYRLVPERETIVAKTHMPYALGAARMAKYRTWFLDPAYTVTALPSYDDDIASNPFAAFHDLPLDGRYRFMLDEAEFFVMNFIKGPVCRGQLALDVIEDRFWVFFVDPNVGDDAMVSELLARERGNLRLPAERGSNSLALIPWIEYSKLETNYLRAKSEWLESHAVGRKDDLSMIWDGDGRNPNAALTVFRHFDSATVVKGLVGEQPKTAWVIGYPLFERIYYLLVAGYDVYGNAGHQLNSRLYMDFLRMEGEFNFLVLLPEKARRSTAEYWYRGAPKEVVDYVYGRDAYFNRPSGLTYRTSDPQRELYEMLSARVAPVAAKRYRTFIGGGSRAAARPAGVGEGARREPRVVARGGVPARRAADRSAPVLQCPAQYRAQECCAHVQGGTAAGGEHAHGRTGLPRRLSERDLQRQGSGPACARECNRIDGVGRRLPPARRSLRGSPHQPTLLGDER